MPRSGKGMYFRGFPNLKSLRIRLRKVGKDNYKLYLKKRYFSLSQSSGNKTHKSLGYLSPCEYIVCSELLVEKKNREGDQKKCLCEEGTKDGSRMLEYEYVFVCMCVCAHMCVNMTKHMYMHGNVIMISTIGYN